MLTGTCCRNHCIHHYTLSNELYISPSSAYCPFHFSLLAKTHDDVIKWKHFPRHWSFVRGIHWSPVNFPLTRNFDVFLDLRLTNSWANRRDAGDLRRHRAQYDVTVIENAEAYPQQLAPEAAWHSDPRTNLMGRFYAKLIIIVSVTTSIHSKILIIPLLSCHMSVITSEIAGELILCSTAFSGLYLQKHPSFISLALCERNPPVISGFASCMVRYAG